MIKMKELKQNLKTQILFPIKIQKEDLLQEEEQNIK